MKVTDKYLTQPPDFTGFNAPDKGQTAAAGHVRRTAPTSSTRRPVAPAPACSRPPRRPASWAIGVDSDQYLSADRTPCKDVILTSALKRVDVAVYDFIKSFVDGLAADRCPDLRPENEGVGYSKSNPAVQPYEAKADEAARQIIAGTDHGPDKLIAS